MRGVHPLGPRVAAATICAVIGAMVTGCLLAAPAAASPPARAHSAQGGVITADWNGSLDWTEVYDPSNPAILMNTGSVTWQYSATYRDTASGGMLVGQPKYSLSGTLTQTAAPPNQGLDCTATLSARPGAQWSTDAPARVVTEGTRALLSWFPPWTGEWAQSSLGAANQCGTVPNGGSPGSPCGPDINKLIEVQMSALPYRQNYAVSGTGTVTGTPSGPVNCWMSASAEVVFSGDGALGHPIGSTPGRWRAKALAAVGLQDTLQQMLYPCIAASATAPLIALGPPGQIAALVIGPIAGPLCLAYVKTVNALANVLADPPLRSYRLIARVRPARAGPTLPSCSQASGPAGTLCAALEPALRKLLSAAQRTEAVAAAMSTTVARESGAASAHNAAAVKQQDAALSGLDKKFAADAAAQAAAGTAVGAVVSPAALPLTLTSTQAASAQTTVLAAVRKAGASAKQLALIRGLLSAAPNNWLSALTL